MVSEGNPLATKRVGTDFFMAPEIANPLVLEYNYKCDIYSLGAMFYYLTTHIPPFGTDKNFKILFNIQHNIPVLFDKAVWEGFITKRNL